MMPKIAKKPKIAIFDYGAGNLFSLKSSLERNGAGRVAIVQNMKNLDKFDGLVLPGVGNFDPAIKSIEGDKRRFSAAVKRDMPIMGICLGMEMLFNKSEEGVKEGLKIVDGEVVMLPKDKVKIPHMGWNNLDISAVKGRASANGSNSDRKESKILKGVENGSWVYFVHSYRTAPSDDCIVTAKSDYGGTQIPAVIEKGNLIGVQFHPEKSGDVGAKMIRNFVTMCSANIGIKGGNAAKEQKIKRTESKGNMRTAHGARNNNNNNSKTSKEKKHKPRLTSRARAGSKKK